MIHLPHESLHGSDAKNLQLIRILNLSCSYLRCMEYLHYRYNSLPTVLYLNEQRHRTVLQFNIVNTTGPDYC